MLETVHAIIVDRATPDQLNSIHEIIKKKAAGWWHHFGSMWIVGGDIPASEWRDAVKDVLQTGGPSVLVIKLPPEGSRRWSFFGTNAKEKCDWIHRNYS